MLQIFFTGFSTKKITKMLRKISRTHRKRFKNFCEENWTGKGANSKRTARNMQDRGCE
jgi:mRNA-degrading endonuclease RelE of RelBE toxin-antitoxin system